jgi:hypothetical protein
MPNNFGPAVIILGMHRSGTSAVAGTAIRLGLAPPLTPLPQSADNPNGFYESVPVMQLNHQVLKDPRLCLTLPVWLPALRELAAEISVLLVVRHPEEVARSLARRNQLPEDETIPNWLHHMLEAERLTRGLNRAVLFYDDLLTDWRRCITRAGRIARIAWPRPMTGLKQDIDDFLARSSRHHRVPQDTAVVGPSPVCDMVNVAWIALRRLSDDPESPGALDYLDHVRAAFATWRRQTHPPGLLAVIPSA